MSSLKKSSKKIALSLPSLSSDSEDSEPITRVALKASKKEKKSRKSSKSDSDDETSSIFGKMSEEEEESSNDSNSSGEEVEAKQQKKKKESKPKKTKETSTTKKRKQPEDKDRGNKVLTKEQLKEEAAKEKLKKYRAALAYVKAYEEEEKRKREKETPTWLKASHLIDKAAKACGTWKKRLEGIPNSENKTEEEIIELIEDRKKNMLLGIKKTGLKNFEDAQKLIAKLNKEDLKLYESKQERNKNAEKWEDLVSKTDHKETQDMELFIKSYRETLGAELPAETIDRIKEVKKNQRKAKTNPQKAEIPASALKPDDGQEIVDPLKTTENSKTPLSPDMPAPKVASPEPVVAETVPVAETQPMSTEETL